MNMELFEPESNWAKAIQNMREKPKKRSEKDNEQILKGDSI